MRPISLLLPMLLLFISGCKDPKDGLVEACEAVLKDTLVSPAGYKSVSTTHLEGKATPEEYFAHMNFKYPSDDDQSSDATIRRLIKKQIEDGTFEVISYKVIMEFDAPNAYGTPIREKVLCTYVGTSPPRGVEDRKDVRIDGKSDFDRLMDTAKRFSR